MSRFINPKATDRFVLGPCECPGTPHGEDWMLLRSEFGAQDIATFLTTESGVDRLAIALVDWNLLEDDGTAAPVDRAHMERLLSDTPIFPKIVQWIMGHSRVSLPNASGAPSANGSPEGAFPTPRTPTSH